ncbi:germination protein Ger(X)C family [Firmicutes bacterium CAG:822]|nr:germination protein Ger(X)C family [Firmicutes bacterium CAG:822]
MKKFTIIIITFIIAITLTGCGGYEELNNLSIVTAVAFDKTDDEYELSFLIANSPKAQTSAKEGEAKTTVYTGKGKTIAEASKDIEQIVPKQIYLGHINVVVISEDIAEDGFLKIADWLLRNPQTRKKFYLLQAKDVSAKNILKIVSPLESFPSQSIATLIESNSETKSIAASVTYSNFIAQILEKGYDPVLPSITIKGDVEEGSNEKNLETTEPESYLVLGPLAIYKGDKLEGFSNEKESWAINVLKNEAKEVNYNVKYQNQDISIETSSLKSDIKIIDENNIEITISGVGDIYNINNQIDIQNYKEINKIEKTWSKSLKKDLSKVVKKVQSKYKADIFGFGNLIYKNDPKTWEKLEKEWNSKYFPNLNVKIKTNLKISATGSLVKTIKEDKS